MPTRLEPAVADALLDRLAQDYEFRALFSAVPQTPSNSSGTSPPTVLRRTSGSASKEVIRGARDELRSMLTSELSLRPHRLDA